MKGKDALDAVKEVDALMEEFERLTLEKVDLLGSTKGRETIQWLEHMKRNFTQISNLWKSRLEDDEPNVDKVMASVKLRQEGLKESLSRLKVELPYIKSKLDALDTVKEVDALVEEFERLMVIKVDLLGSTEGRETIQRLEDVKKNFTESSSYWKSLLEADEVDVDDIMACVKSHQEDMKEFISRLKEDLAYIKNKREEQRKKEKKNLRKNQTKRKNKRKGKNGKGKKVTTDSPAQTEETDSNQSETDSSSSQTDLQPTKSTEPQQPTIDSPSSSTEPDMTQTREELSILFRLIKQYEELVNTFEDESRNKGLEKWKLVMDEFQTAGTINVADVINAQRLVQEQVHQQRMRQQDLDKKKKEEKKKKQEELEKKKKKKEKEKKQEELEKKKKKEKEDLERKKDEEDSEKKNQKGGVQNKRKGGGQ